MLIKLTYDWDSCINSLEAKTETKDLLAFFVNDWEIIVVFIFELLMPKGYFFDDCFSISISIIYTNF